MVQPAYIIFAFNNKEYYIKSGFNLFEVRDILVINIVIFLYELSL